MKASEVVNKYATGERDFHGANLRGLSFKNQDLSGADFSGADIRSTNFTGANLTGAKFIKAQAGLQKRWAILLVLLSWFMAFSSSVFSWVVTFWIPAFYSSYLDLDNFEATVASTIYSLIMLAFLATTVRRGLKAGAIAAVIAVALAGLSSMVLAANVALLGAFAGAGALIAALAVALAVAGGFTGAVAVAGLSTGIIAIMIAIVFAGALAAVWAALTASGSILAGVVAFAFITALVLLFAYLGWRAWKGDYRDAWIRSFAIAFAAMGGTSFRQANLTDADFTGAKLKSTDLREATIIRTCWRNVQKLDRVRPGKTYLRLPQLQPWLVAVGTEKNFDSQVLRGIYLQGANLTDASFIGADLSEANLQDVDLSRAKLVQTQLDQTDFTGATLTGAYIEDWGITGSTKFSGARCAYVFMRLPTDNNPNPERKPDNWEEEFADGEFGDFIKPIVDTLDLYHNQNVDPRAIAVSFKQLAENNPDAQLEIVAMERRGEDKVLIRAKTATSADKSQLSGEYFELYNHNRALEQKNTHLLTSITQKDERIASLENMITTALQRPSFYAEQYYRQGDTYNISGDHIQQSGNFGVGVNQGTIASEAQVARVINQVSNQDLAEAAQSIQQLLQQLEEHNPTASEAQQEEFISAAIAPTNKAILISALSQDGKEAIEVCIDSPYLDAAMRIIEEWISF